MRTGTTDRLFKVKQLFFDRRAVTSRVDPATRKVLNRFGALVRKTAKWSIRTSKSVSKPGHPPHSHTGLLKRFIFYSYDPVQRSVVIGPAKLNAKGKDIPHVLEYGGMAYRMSHDRRRRRRAKSAARPYMGPAFLKMEPRLPSLWRDSIK